MFKGRCEGERRSADLAEAAAAHVDAVLADEAVLVEGDPALAAARPVLPRVREPDVRVAHPADEERTDQSLGIGISIEGIEESSAETLE